MAEGDVLHIGGTRVALGERRDIELEVTESYSGVPLLIPTRVWRAEQPGPTLFVTAAVHGDELNGTGIVRELMLNPPFELRRGTLILVPVVNMLGFERQSRYLPDRRDLNRSFPGSPDGSLASRFAHTVFREIIRKCDYGIDLHSAAIRRTNFPNIRADLSLPAVKWLSLAFGCELVVIGRGPKGSLRRSACSAGVPTIILEAGEVWKMEPGIIEYGLRGIKNVLIELGLVQGKRRRPAFQALVEKTRWIRADRGGLLQFHVAPGDVVEAGQPIATNTDLFGREQNVVRTPDSGFILGMTTLPTVKPGDPVCHIAVPSEGMTAIRAAVDKLSNKSLHERLKDDLASNIFVAEK